MQIEFEQKFAWYKIESRSMRSKLKFKHKRKFTNKLAWMSEPVGHKTVYSQNGYLRGKEEKF